MVRKLTTISANALLIKLCDTLNNMTETDRPSQAGTYARIQQRLQQIPPAGSCYGTGIINDYCL